MAHMSGGGDEKHGSHFSVLSKFFLIFNIKALVILDIYFFK